MNDKDFERLLPPRDAEYWNPMVRNILKQTVYAPEVSRNLWAQIFRFAVPAIAVATIATIVSWGAVFVVSGRPSQNADFVVWADEPEEKLLSMAIQTGEPTIGQLYNLLGGNDGTNNP